MKDYLRWSIRQLYLLFFCPTQFTHEVEGEGPEGPSLRFKERVWYMLKMLPWMIFGGAVATLVIGFACEAFGTGYPWERWWIGLVTSVVFGMIAGAVGRVAGGVVFCVTFSLAGNVSRAVGNGMEVDIINGMFFGLYYSVARNTTSVVTVAAISGILLGTINGMALSVESGVVSGLWFGVSFGALGGWAVVAARSMARSIVFGAAVGLFFGVFFGTTSGAAVVVSFWLSYFRLFSYPLEAALSFVAYLKARKHPEAIKRAWRLCPITWNEVILLPLPFSAKLLGMLAKHDREEGIRQIAFVAAERRLQKRLAIRAAEEIALADLRAISISHLADVTQKLEWTTDAPTELPEELVAAFPRFERIAQHLSQYLALGSEHRKEGALKQVFAELEGLQKGLILARGRLVPQLLQTANEWRVLLEAEQKVFAAKSAATEEIPNPFAFGKMPGEVKNNTFVGRQDVVQKIEAGILGSNQMPMLLLQGARRMGKTSILYQLPRMLGPGFAPVFIDCQEAAFLESKAAMLRYLSRGISAGLQRRRIKVDPLTKRELESEPFSTFKDWLEDAEQFLTPGLRVLLCFDEYESLQETLDAGWGHSFLDTLRNWVQHHPQLVLMFTGAHAFEELGPEWTDRFISARRMRVSFLAREDVELLLTKPIPEFDMTYQDGALEAIINHTNGQPFLTQAVAFELVQHLNERRRKEASPEDVEQAIAQALLSGSAYFNNVWTDAQKEGQAILTAIARGGAPPPHHGAFNWLRDNDVLNDAGDFAVPMVRRWVFETVVRQNISLGER